MKKICLVISFFIYCTVSFGQDKGAIALPNDVKNAFHRDFPTAASEKWEKEGSNYEVNFKVGSSEMSALYSKAGYRKEVEKGIEESKLPSSVFDYIIKKYPGYKLKSASQITSDKSVVTYEAEITKDNQTLELIFDANGKFKKKE